MRRAAHAAIDEIERPLDALLRNWRTDMQFFRDLRVAEQAWSRAVWSSAESLGASMPPPCELARGLRLAQSPVFVCGAARSGTTLLRDLLDGHPELVVIPAESRFYTGMEAALKRLSPDRHLPFLGCRWLERLVDAPPFWLLGRTERTGSPYVAFARALAGWWRIPELLEDARSGSWPLAAFALAYAQRAGEGRLPPRVRMWVEKSPGSERYVTRVWRDFPAAKVIQIVRRPEAVLASIKAEPSYHWNRRSMAAHILREMASSYRIAAANLRRPRDDRYCLVRYEDLTARPETVMHRIAEFLEIEPLPSLLLPTTAGRPALNNTSFRTPRPDPGRALDTIDRALLRLATGRQAAKLGYAPASPRDATGHAIVGRA